MEKIWLKSYPEGVPDTIDPDYYHSILDVFYQSVTTFADKKAYINFPTPLPMGKSLTFGQLDELTRDVAAYFQSKLKLRKGDRLAIMMPNLLQYPVILFGAMRAGLIIVNVNPLYTARELKHQLIDSGADAIVILANFAHTLEAVLPETKVAHVVVTEIGDLMGLKGKLINFIVKSVKKMVPAFSLPKAISLKEVLGQGQAELFEPVELKGEDIAFLQYTGGTTGVSKGAVLTHRNIIANMQQASVWTNLTKGEELIVTALPLYHIFSLTANCMLFLEAGGCNLLITNPRDIPGFIKVLSQYQITAITGVNTLFNALVNHKTFSTIDFSRLHLTLGGAMAVQRPVADKWKESTGCTLVEAYGLTESSPAVCVNPLDLKDFNGAIGLPLPSTDVSILDENGHEVAIGEEGELAVKGPQVMRGYWNKREETQAIFTQDGWLKTGDMAKLDDKGYVYLVGRKKDMILVSGFNVYPNEVEEVAVSHPSILEAAAIGIPHEKSGEIVKLFVVKKDKGLTEDQVMDHCRESLTGYKVPKVIEFRDELPKTNVGKVLHRALRDEK